MRINNNIMAMNTHRQYTINTNSVAKSTEKLSSGYRINRAGDDAAGLAISEKMRAQIRGLTMASKNSNDAISLVQTAEGALQETHNILQRMRELAVQSASDTNETSIDRSALQQEFAQLQAEIDDIADKTVFNDQKLIDGTFASTIRSTTANTLGAGISFRLGNVVANSYTLSATARTEGAVAGQPPTVAAGNGTGGVTSVAWVDGASLGNTDALNGNYTLKVKEANGGTITFALMDGAKEVRTANFNFAADVDATTGTIALNFGTDFGTLTLTNDGSGLDYATIIGATDDAVTKAAFEKFNGVTVDVSDGVSDKSGTRKFYVTMNGGDEQEVKIGDKGITFSNGISLSFGALGASVLDSAGTDANAEAAMQAFFNGALTVEAKAGKSFIVQTGANQGDELKINIEKMDTLFLGISTASISNQKDASKAITSVNKAINSVSTQRAALGALQNRLGHKINNLDTSAENLQAAESRIRDLDMAKEMTNFTKNNILVQASTAMLAQANAAPQGVLQLLQ